MCSDVEHPLEKAENWQVEMIERAEREHRMTISLYLLEGKSTDDRADRQTEMQAGKTGAQTGRTDVQGLRGRDEGGGGREKRQ